MDDSNHARHASCNCGKLHLTTTGEPEIIGACNCKQCQRRTGTAFSVHAFFAKSAVEVEGEPMTFTRRADSGRSVTFYSCPQCASTVFWQTEGRPDAYAIAIGCFDDSAFGVPERVVYAESQLPWVIWPRNTPRHLKGTASPEIRDEPTG